jgi:hypothetical protein
VNSSSSTIWIVSGVLIVVCALAISSCLNKGGRGPEVRNVRHGGHSYLVFRQLGYCGQTFVHDPNCECQLTQPTKENQ